MSQRRQRVAAGVVLVLGAALLAATLHVPRWSGWFTTLGLTLAINWFAGAFLLGPVPIRRPRSTKSWTTLAALAVAVGGTAYLAFVAASRIASHVPVVSGAVDSVLSSADSGPSIAVLVVALVNGVAEEAFFRGALHNALDVVHPALTAVVIYVAVTAVTGNVALIVAAMVMGPLFSYERTATGSVMPPVITHVTWSALMLTALPH